MRLGRFKSQKKIKLLKRSGSYSRATAKSPGCLFMGTIPVTLAYIKWREEDDRQVEMFLRREVAYFSVRLNVVDFKDNLQFSVNTRSSRE